MSSRSAIRCMSPFPSIPLGDSDHESPGSACCGLNLFRREQRSSHRGVVALTDDLDDRATRESFIGTRRQALEYLTHFRDVLVNRQHWSLPKPKLLKRVLVLGSVGKQTWDPQTFDVRSAATF